MKDNRERILGDYTDADFNKRLHIFLDYPPLRPEFLLIDQYEQKNVKSTGRNSHRRPITSQLHVAFSLVTNGFKKLLGIESA